MLILERYDESLITSLQLTVIERRGSYLVVLSTNFSCHTNWARIYKWWKATVQQTQHTIASVMSGPGKHNTAAVVELEIAIDVAGGDRANTLADEMAVPIGKVGEGTRMLAEIWRTRAKLLFGLKRMSEARRVCDRCLDFFPGDAELNDMLYQIALRM